MIDAGFRDRLETLFPATLPRTTRVYATLDAARDPRLFELVTGSDLPHVCLFRGELSTPVLRASPWLVGLERDAPLVRVLLGEGFGKAWGVYWHAPADLELVRRHLRSFLRARVEGGGTVLFRYYDPRVFRVYLPTVNEAERRAVFGPVHRIFVEDEQGAGFLVHGSVARAA